MFAKHSALRRTTALLLGFATAALLPMASAQNAVRGKALYFNTNGDAALPLSGTAVQISMAVTPPTASLQAAVGTMSAPVQEVISNTGQSTLTIGSITTVGPSCCVPVRTPAGRHRSR